MLKTLNKKVCLMLIVLVIILIYYFWPKTFDDEDIISIQINKEIEGASYTYELNEQEFSDFVKILKKSRFYRGVSRPDRMFANKCIGVIVIGGPLIEIYYNADKTYVYANISTPMFLNVFYRISNKEEIRIFIEKISNSRNTEFEKVPIFYNTGS